MIERIHNFPWHRYGQPEWNNEASVIRALSEMWRAENDLEHCSSACDNLLQAIGNNHQGTYYPVLIPVMPFIEEILRSGNQWQIRVLLCLLDDLTQVFQPMGGYETLQISDDQVIDTELAFKRKMFELRPVLENIISSDDFNAETAKDLILWLDENEA